MEMLVAGRVDLVASSGPALPSQQHSHLHSQRARSVAQEPNSAVWSGLGDSVDGSPFNSHHPSPSLSNTTREPGPTLARIPATTGAVHPVGRKEREAAGNQETRYSLDVIFPV